MGDVIRLRTWLIHSLEDGKLSNSPKANDLYFHYHRMRLYEAELSKQKLEGGNDETKRNLPSP